jgi:glycosyltransferase involved in cell wall biosynthesis
MYGYFPRIFPRRQTSMHAHMNPLQGDTLLHICFYCNLMGWPKRSGGGVRQWVLTMANALVDAGHKVDVLSEAPASRFIDEPLLDPRVGRVLLGKGLLSGLRLRRFVRRHPDVRVVAALDYYNLRAARLKRRFGDRVHVMLTQRENLSADASWRKAGKYRRTTRDVRRYFSDADAVVTVSHGLLADLRDRFGVDPSRLHTIYNPAFRRTFLDSAAVPIAHPWLGDPARPLVIAAGRLHHVKGFDDLLRAFARLPASLGARLIILGEGKERGSLEALVRELKLDDIVELPGRMPSTAPWMARADLFVLSSRREGLPAVLIEALASGLPVVSTRCPSGPDEILDNGRLGRLVDVGDIDGLAQAITATLRTPDIDRAALRARAAEFSLDRALQQYLALWRQAPRSVPTSARRALVYASKSTLPSEEANAVHVMQMCDAFSALGLAVTLRAKRGAQSGALATLYGLRNRFRTIFESATSRRLWLLTQRLRARLTGIDRHTLHYGRRLEPIFALAAAGYPAALELHHPPRGEVQSTMLRRLIRQPGFLGLVSISARLRDELLRRLPELSPSQILVAHDGTRADQIRMPALHGHQRIQVLYAGSLHRGKGVETLIAAARLCPECDFHVIGGGDAHIESLRTQAPANVHFHGRLPHAQLQRRMVEFDIALAPYGYVVRGARTPDGETLADWMSPLKIFEYMAAGLPIISSDLPVLREILESEHTALLVTPDDATALAAAVRRLAADPVLRLTLARTAQMRLAEFTWERRAQRILAFLDSRLAAQGFHANR